MGNFKWILIILIIIGMYWYMNANVTQQGEAQSMVKTVLDRAKGMVELQGETVINTVNPETGQTELGRPVAEYDCSGHSECREYFSNDLAKCNISTGVCYLP